jgi:hypothetical protein
MFFDRKNSNDTDYQPCFLLEIFQLFSLLRAACTGITGNKPPDTVVRALRLRWLFGLSFFSL